MEDFAHQHFLQLHWLEQVHQISVTHLVETSFELLEHILDGCVEGMIHIGIHKLLPVLKTKVSGSQTNPNFFNVCFCFFNVLIGV